MPRLKPTFIIATFSLLALSSCKRAETGPKPTQAKAAPSPTPTTRAETSAVNWKTVEEFDYSWATTQPPIHFKLELPAGYDDPGDFTRLRIQAPGQQEFVLENQDGWIEYDGSLARSKVYSRLHQQNLVESRYLLFLPASKRQGDPPLLFLRSWGYASDPERLHIIGFQGGGRPILLFNDKFDLVDFTDLDGDGDPEIAGWPCFGEGLGADLATYAPRRVYKIPPRASGPAVVSIPLSERYNLEQNYPWAGLDCNPQLSVVLHPPGGGKAVVMDEEKARKLIESLKNKQ